MACCFEVEKKKRTPQWVVQTFSLPTDLALDYSFPSDVRRAFVKVYGAGGSGSIPFNQDVDIFTAGAGGGGGGYTEGNVLVKKNHLYRITVGRGGPAIDSSGDGEAGGFSAFEETNGIILRAEGGRGGSASGDRLGGAGGTASGGGVIYAGERGQPGMGPPGFVQVGRTGAGGGSPMGGQGGFPAAFSLITFGGIIPGAPGVAPGAGGGAGGAIFSGGGTFFGSSGRGADGQVQVSYETFFDE